MLAVIQRCTSSSITIDNKIISEISLGLLILLGVCKGDEKKDCEYLAKKITTLRIFSDKKGKMNLSVSDVKGSILVVSQFTLCANLKKGSRPSFIQAETPKIGKLLYDYFVSCLRKNGAEVQTGIFGANMDVELVNQGPATFVIDTKV